MQMIPSNLRQNHFHKNTVYLSTTILAPLEWLSKWVLETQSTTFDNEDLSRMKFDPPRNGEDLCIVVGPSVPCESSRNLGSKFIDHEEDVGDENSCDSNL